MGFLGTDIITIHLIGQINIPEMFGKSLEEVRQKDFCSGLKMWLAIMGLMEENLCELIWPNGAARPALPNPLNPLPVGEKY